MRLLITGVPKSGKTTLADSLPWPVFRTDDLIGQGSWRDQIKEVVKWMQRPGPWTIEGIMVPHAIKKLERPEIDFIVFLWKPRVKLTPKQSSVAKGIITAYLKVRHVVPEITIEELRRRVT